MHPSTGQADPRDGLTLRGHHGGRVKSASEQVTAGAEVRALGVLAGGSRTAMAVAAAIPDIRAPTGAPDRAILSAPECRLPVAGGCVLK
jgi:hypothetical protein